MIHEVDASFRQRKAQREAQLRHARTLRRWRLRAAAGTALCAALAFGFWLDRTSRHTDSSSVDDRELTQIDVETVVAAHVPAIVDLPGDPIRIEIGGEGGTRRLQAVDAPRALADFGVSGTVHMLSARLIESGERITVTVPSTQQDFAFFQSQRSGGRTSPTRGAGSASAVADSPPEGEMPFSVDTTAQGGEPATAGWGDIAVADLTGSAEAFTPTAIADNTTTLVLTPEQARLRLTEDLVIRINSIIDVADFMTDHGVNLLDAQRIRDAFRSGLELEQLQPNSVVALRKLPLGGAGGGHKLVQIALYQSGRFLGALAVGNDNEFTVAADPWAGTNFFAQDDMAVAADAPPPQVRLLDAIFSATAGNGVPSGIAGEVIMYLARSRDINAVVKADDTITLVYAGEGRLGGESRGRVLYAAINGGGGTFRCFVFQSEGAPDFNCHDEHDSSGTVETVNGMVTPVSGGVKTSGFGPRNHPILKRVLLHKGVDWAAPIGTPVRAAFDGRVASAAVEGAYGNVIRLKHGGQRETLYAHLDSFASTATPGADVSAGDVIGFVGTTGRSTGPHLHFELHANGHAINPLAQATVVAATGGGEAVSRLVDRIIHVESGGNATAKNPLSTATGLGQFIESTWLRMMRTYRPDLAASLSKEQQLAMRFDPTLSREMVTNLAQENKSYLEAGGHMITAGRLYLAHFLGPEGARLVLSSEDGADLGALLGAQVIEANPFLTGKDVAFIKNWAERKMGGKAPAATSLVAQTEVRQMSERFKQYRTAILELTGQS
ncbi:MAG: M23 family metallopeptidase [Rhizobiaceae bacterium]|jgi:murein DD-endopeptidase MepM/ murein hydrolase activator NlpD|nr:M23 family metallopeptidase [Rhizobiaceae bacterium]